MQKHRGPRVLFIGALSLAALTHTTSAHAQASPPPIDPIIGTWELDPTSTEVSPGFPFPAPAQRTEVYRQTDSEQIELAVSTGNRTGTPTVTILSSVPGGVLSVSKARHRRKRSSRPASHPVNG
jgi:hypothetical protein